VRNFLKWYDPEHSLFLSSPFQGLAKGVNTHNLPLKETKRHGDLGMGVLSQDAGHFIILDNELFYLDPSGQVAPPPDQAMVSFSGATYFQPQTEEAISSPVEHPPMLELLPRLIPSNNLIYALRIDGDFRNLALAGGETLVQASGTVVGFYIPAFLKGAAGDGFALGFIDRDRKQGGRILQAEIVDVKVSIMQVTKLEMCLPLTMDYLTADL
jgi:acetolactate decarboxylase